MKKIWIFPVILFLLANAQENRIEFQKGGNLLGFDAYFVYSASDKGAASEAAYRHRWFLSSWASIGLAPSLMFSRSYYLGEQNVSFGFALELMLDFYWNLERVILKGGTGLSSAAVVRYYSRDEYRFGGFLQATRFLDDFLKPSPSVCLGLMVPFNRKTMMRVEFEYQILNQDLRYNPLSFNTLHLAVGLDFYRE